MSTNSDCALIEENIFLGNQLIVTNCELIKSLDIRRVLMIGINRIIESKQISSVYYKHISVLNEDIEELIIHFIDCFGFIFEAQSYGENVLIISENEESISFCVLSAFLMKKYKISSEEAITRVSQKRVISLNKTFVDQLNVWQNMSFELIGNNSDLRQILFKALRHRIDIMIEKLHSCEERELYIQCHNKYWTNLWKVELSDHSFTSGKGFYCLKCGLDSILFYECHVFQNDVSTECVYIYSQPESWNTIIITDSSIYSYNFIFGPIYCQKCSTILGEFNWDSKNVCNCPLHKGLETFQVFRYLSNRIVKE